MVYQHILRLCLVIAPLECARLAEIEFCTVAEDLRTTAPPVNVVRFGFIYASRCLCTVNMSVTYAELYHTLINIIFRGVRGWIAPNLSITRILPNPPPVNLSQAKVWMIYTHLINTDIVDLHGGRKLEVGRYLR